ncbi:MAG: SLBB domain-containing protein [Pirellulales bacterium]|nr:SLBB domain-containing protein [Pirellulales bacterium]
MPSSPRICHRNGGSAWQFAALAAVWAGCGAPGIRPASLPPELLAAPRNSRATINLASVATPGVADSNIAPGDLLELTITSGRDGEQPQPTLARVGDDGRVDVPLVGLVPVAGLEAAMAELAVGQAAVDRGIYRRPHVAVELKSKSVNHVTVLGAVTTPGVHEISRTNCNLVAAIAAAGGLNEEAGTIVEIVRQPKLIAGEPALHADAGLQDEGIQQASYRAGGAAGLATAPRTQRINLSNPAAVPGCVLGDRDVVVVKPRDKDMIYVAGIVKQPGQFEMPEDRELRLLDAVALAGGLDSPVADQVLVVRNVPGRPDPVPIRCSIAAAKRQGSENLVLAPGDAISIEQTAATAVVDVFRNIFRMSFGLTRNASFF